MPIRKLLFNGKGRPSKYTPERVKKFLEGLETGLTRQAAAGLIDTDQVTVFSWMKTEPGFAEQVETAEQRAEARFTAVIARAANNGDWQAAKYWLSHRRRRDWGDSVTVQLDIEIQQLIAQLTGESEPIEIESEVVHPESEIVSLSDTIEEENAESIREGELPPNNEIG